MQGLMKRWLAPPASDPAQPIALRILDARGYATKEQRDAFLDPKLSMLDDPSTLHGAEKAADILCSALKGGKKVLIFGDYDADGITASTVLYHTIAAATGGEGPTIYIPDRIDEGYGIRPEAMEQFAASGVDLVISVDCGITAVETARRARELGLSFIITDHHKPREDGELPDCDAIVHPDLSVPLCRTPMAGVGVAYQLAWAFARAWSNSHHVNDKLKQALLDMIPIVAIGTIADMVPLLEGNRIFVRWGLQLLPDTKNPGLRAIMAQLDTPKKLNTSHVSFGIAPLINAVGRLAHAATAVDLLTRLDDDLAKSAAGELADLNRKRQGVQREIVAQALEQISERNLEDHSIIVLHNDNWKRGVVGVAAGKCIEAHYRPTILLSGDGDELVGSARSISGFSIFDALVACQEHLVTYGGHDMAAGLTVKREEFETFVNAINQYAKETITPELLVPTIKPDVLADLNEITHASAMEIEKIGPFGIGNATPIVQIKSVPVDEAKAMGKEGSHLSIRVGRSSQNLVRCVWWNHGSLQPKIHRGMVVDLVGRVKINEFRGNYSAELDLLDISLPSS
ncbi:MAG: single-stranded-DNA-specific exonuclease RecJ [Planctomycetota bacterium]|nr:single-stranded-DNA-specific exonuclease RecJ [Planctomycetota bacterium]